MGHRCRLGARTTIGIAFRGNCGRTFDLIDGILRLFRFLKLYGFLGTSSTKGTPPAHPRRVQPSGYIQPHRLRLSCEDPGSMRINAARLSCRPEDPLPPTAPSRRHTCHENNLLDEAGKSVADTYPLDPRGLLLHDDPSRSLDLSVCLGLRR
jgi:hypothetical protein